MTSAATDPADPGASVHEDDLALIAANPWTLRTMLVLAIPLVLLPSLYAILLSSMPNLKVRGKAQATFPPPPWRLKKHFFDYMQDHGIPQAAWAAVKPPHKMEDIKRLRDVLADFAGDNPVRRPPSPSPRSLPVPKTI